MVSQVSGNAGLSAAMLSGSQCRGPRDTSALQEKLFSKLDVNGDGGVDASELGKFLDFASSSSGGTSQTDSAQLFKSLDTNGDGALSKTELADGAKKLFDELRSQLMTTSGDTSQETKPQGPPSGAPPRGGHGGGLFSKIESLLDQYRSTATDTTIGTEAATVSIAA